MFLTILIILAVVVVGFILVVSMKPADFRITRSLVIPAPASFVFEQVDDLHLWEAWSPWVRMETDIEKTYSGPASGVGASYAWEGKKTGTGRMTNIESCPNELLRFDLFFEKPFKAHNVAEFTFKPDGNQTLVTWTMTGKNNFMGKVFSVIVNCDKMIGGQFEDGLKNLKEVAEQAVPA